MDAERFTESTLSAIQSAQQIARTRGHQTVTPAHLATALLADSNSPAARVLVRAGGDLQTVQGGLNRALEGLPKVAGSDGQYLSPALAKAFDEAEKIAKDWNDTFVAADALLVALRRTAGDELGSLLPPKPYRTPRRRCGEGEPWTANPLKRPLKPGKIRH